jgi:hypothetical protein
MPCASTNVTTMRTGRIQASPTPDRSAHCPNRSQNQPGLPALTSDDTTASVAYSASTDKLLDLGGRGFPGPAGSERVAAGFVSFRSGLYGGVAKHWEIGIALLPEWRGRGIGWRAQAMICD